MREMPRNCFFEQLSDTRISIADICEYENLGWIITRINVPAEFRGTGAGTRLLKQITDDADEHGVTLWLEISPSDGLNYEELEAWYKRHGFRWYRGSFGIMRRRPARRDLPGGNSSEVNCIAPAGWTSIDTSHD